MTYADAGKSQTNVIPRSPREQAYLVKEHILPVMKKHSCISNPTPAKTTSQSNSEVIKAKVGIRSRSGSGEVHLKANSEKKKVLLKKKNAQNILIDEL